MENKQVVLECWNSGWGIKRKSCTFIEALHWLSKYHYTLARAYTYEKDNGQKVRCMTFKRPGHETLWDLRMEV